MSDVRPRPGGRYSLFCYDCQRWIPNTANDEMRKEGVYAHSHICVVKDGELIILGEQGIEEQYTVQRNPALTRAGSVNDVKKGDIHE